MKIEQKAEAYDKAIDRVKKLKENPQTVEYSPKDVDTICDYIFPELKKEQRVDDETLRKNLIKAFNTVGGKHWGGLEVREILNWLEKKDEQKPQGKTVLEEVKEEKVDSQKMEVADLVTDNTIFCTKEVLTSDEAARYLGMAKSYLYKLTSKKEIPHFKPLGKMCYFNRQELEAWLQSNRVATETELKKIENENKH